MERRLQRSAVDAAAILDAFAASTGLTAAAQPRRYLWTDAFAVMTWVGLYGRTGDRRFLDLALRLVGQVHEILGAPRGGLRIGKPLPERRPEEPYDPELEWQRDGQYHHYLTKWMHALQRTTSASGDERYRRQAVELAQRVHRGFVHPGGIYWKMSIDLSRPLVSSMGAHDPLDGLVEAAALGLERETRELARICEGRRWVTDDPLGAGGLLLAALRLARLGMLTPQILEDAALSAEAAASGIGGPASQRLPFRELGFALGLHAVEPLGKHVRAAPLERFVALAPDLEEFWLDPVNQAAPTWTGHRDINAVTLAACLAPDGVLS